MTQLGMNSALWGVYTSAENAERIRTEPEAYLASFELSAEEATALAAQDYATLLQLGAHPFLMFKMAFRLAGGFSMEFIQGYVGQLEGLDLRDIVT
jgi:protocatechuate 4,5-dioxygenase alpha chain